MEEEIIEKEESGRRTLRVSLHNEMHKDVLKIWDACPRPLRHELLVESIRCLRDNRMNVMTGKIVEDKSNNGGANLLDLFS